ncbi:Protein of unknown function [Bacillus mycoides]|nr:Protein of unknown function [Bacillus mycoides]SCM87314.1 Protein of unknown function [Bacillus mycoides]
MFELTLEMKGVDYDVNDAV